jgi:hypothetical protein
MTRPIVRQPRSSINGASTQSIPVVIRIDSAPPAAVTTM